MENCPRDIALPEEVVLDAVAFPIGWSLDFESLRLHFRRLHPVIARGDCVRCPNPVPGAEDEPPPQIAAGWAFVGFAEDAGSAVVFVRRHLVRGAVVSATGTRGVFKREAGHYEDTAVWLVHVDPRKRMAEPLPKDNHLYAPFIQVEDPTVDLPLFGPVRRHRLLPIPAIEKEGRIGRHRRNTINQRLPKGYNIPCRPRSSPPNIT
jgi:hypothetical protein